MQDEYITMNNIVKPTTQQNQNHQNQTQSQSQSGLSKFDRYKHQDDDGDDGADMDDGKFGFRFSNWNLCIDFRFVVLQMDCQRKCQSWYRSCQRRCRQKRNRSTTDWENVVRFQAFQVSTPANWNCFGQHSRQSKVCKVVWAEVLWMPL